MLIFTRLMSLLLAAIATSPHAMSFDARPPLLYLSGRVATSDWPAWEDAMSRFKIDTVVFGHSPGGNSQTGRLIGAYIREKRMKTVVAGRCMSACANMFLGGVERQFIASFSEQPTVLGYHGTYRRTGEHIDRGIDYFMNMSDGKIPDGLAKAFVAIENQRGALYFIHREQRGNESQALAYFCEGEEVHTRRDEQCRNLHDVDAVEAGILTTWTLRDVPRPSFEPTKRQLQRGGYTIKGWE